MVGFYLHLRTDYIKNVASQNDTSVADTDSCKNIGRFVVVAEDGTENVEYYQYQCFEKDPIWGIVTCFSLDFGGGHHMERTWQTSQLAPLCHPRDSLCPILSADRDWRKAVGPHLPWA